MAFNIIGWALTIALVTPVVYVVIGILLLPVWGAGAALNSDRLTRWGRGWWQLPWLAVERGHHLVDTLTRPRDGSRFARPPAPTQRVTESQDGDLARALGQIVLWGLAVVGGLVLFMTGHDSIVQPLGGGSAGVLIAVLAVLCTISAGTAAWVLSRRYRYGQRPPAFRLCIAAATVLGLFSYLMITELQYSDRMVGDYCAYGSVSEAQLASCKSHVTANDVRSRDTPAARFAENGSSDDVCGTGSGPFCQEVLDRRYLDEQAPPPGQ
ncbi:MAG TPA: hypothetical protein VE972_09565 [Conexibacter sp.]|nr:hypothetical protein [Conexibacter sp.]